MDQSERLKILQVCSADDLGGGELHVADLSRALVERGHEVHLAARRGSAIARELGNENIEIHEIPLRNASDVGSALRLARIIRARNIDVMHAHVARDYPVCGLAARLSSAAFLITRHHFRPFPKSRVYQWAMSPARALIAVSRGVAGGMAAAFPNLKDRIVVVPNWVDVERPGRVSRAEARRYLGLDRPLTLAVVGRISPIKQQHLFLQACAQLDDSILERTNILLVGSAVKGDEDYAQQISGLVRETGLSERVRMPGFIPEFSNYLAAIDLAVIPSVNEGFSLVVIECMAAGVAVVASNIGGPSEIIEHDVSGVLVPAGDVDALSQAMSELLSDDQRRLKIGRAGREVAHCSFAREKVLDEIEEVYRRII